MSEFENFRLLHPGWRDLLEIALVSYVTYRVLLLFQRTRAVRILLGLAVLVAGYAAAYVLKLGMITYLLGLMFQYGAIALLIVFHPELRAGLAHLGRTRRLFAEMGDEAVADEVAKACERLSGLGIGGIIAIERQVRLDEYLGTGSELQARVSADLLVTIFTPYSPLHDGAVIIRGDAVIGAGCILPLSQTPLLDRALGTRHRAALGLTEETDAIVVIVSEETGAISVAIHERLWRNLSPGELKQRIIHPLDHREPEKVGITA
ncbi:MAG TPA: diadenylate cyclase CdaA [Gemmatimonadaceae bacterium]|nr:diadenylate cyclase CdaA [Gemmatimonadaceae bacterium]